MSITALHGVGGRVIVIIAASAASLGYRGGLTINRGRWQVQPIERVGGGKADRDGVASFCQRRRAIAGGNGDGGKRRCSGIVYKRLSSG